MSNLINGIDFNLSSLENFNDSSLARKCLDVIFSGPKFQQPKMYGQLQPLKYKVTDIESIVNLWTTGTSGILRKSRTDGTLILEFCRNGSYMISWSKAEPPEFASVDIGIPLKLLEERPDYLNEMIKIYFELVTILNPVYGSITNMMHPGWDTPLNLKLRLPEIPWLSVYGQPYIEMFGKNQILSAPFHRIVELESGHLVLQATESVFDPVPKMVREKIRKHLGEESFMAGTRWKYNDGRAPVFDYSRVMR